MVLGQTCARIAQAIGARGVRYDFPVLCDPARETIRRYGVWHPIGFDAFNTAHPASFLIDAASRRVRYAFVGSSQFARAPLDAILDAAMV